jgi:glyceraldehyde 3-phosphate dehydrogenase
MAGKVKVGVNGFGRIGRYFTRLCIERDDIEVVVVNDLAPINTLTHLLKYDSVHGRMSHELSVSDDKLTISNGKSIRFTQFKAPSLSNRRACSCPAKKQSSISPAAPKK